jgi:glycosyltransferase involved in cell wall biosynthesis
MFAAANHSWLRSPISLIRTSEVEVSNENDRIAIFLPSLEGGGAERSMCRLAMGLAKRGVQVDLVLAKKIGPYLQQLPASVRVVDLRSSRMIASIPNLVRYLRDERPGSLISALSHANVIAILSHLLASSRAKLIVSERAPLFQAQANAKFVRDRILPFLMRALYNRADHIIAISRGVADQLAAAGIPGDKIAVIHNPVVDNTLLEKAKEALDHHWFVPDAPPVIVAAGRLEKEKDFQTLIRAFSLIRKTRAIRLMILGEGESRAELHNMAKQLGVVDDVSLPGFVDNPYKYMKHAAAFVLSSLFEGFGNVIVEAMACGTPVISTDCPCGPAEILEKGRWGRLVAVGDAKAMAKAIEEVLDEVTHPDVRSRAAVFNVENMTNEYLRFAAAECTRVTAAPKGWN